MTGPTGAAERLAAVERAFRTLPERYLGADEGFDATYHVRLGDVGRVWELQATPHALRVRKGMTRERPDVTIGTDAATWLQLREGELSGLEAFQERRLSVRGDLDLAVGLEGLFRLPGPAGSGTWRDPLLRVRDVRVDGLCISTLTLGAGPDVLLIHGLGATKASFFDTAAALGRAGYRVHAIDLPGFGSSSKPVLAPYNARYFARIVLALLDELGIARTHVVGNSMGGRVALELGLRHPERIAGLALLCPAVAFVDRAWLRIVQLLRPELGAIPHRFARPLVARQFWSMFADRDLVDPSVGDIAIDEFMRLYGSVGARQAFLRSARNIYLDHPFGPGGFYPRLSGLRPPALFVWASHDKLISPHFSRHVEEWLPSAEQIILADCGHAPQVERPEQIDGLLRRFFAQVDALGRPHPVSAPVAALAA